MPIYNGIINQKGTPAFYSDIFANRPAFGYAGRVFISTDTGAIYEDTGSAWTLIADAGAGTTGTLQQVTTNGNTTTLGISVQGIDINDGAGTGTENTAIGKSSLANNTTGINNTALGSYSLGFNTTGNNNTALGVNSLITNTTGIQNTAIGVSALYTNTTGGNNAAVGYNSLFLNTTGSNNTALGVAALGSNTTASQNTAVGNSSLTANTTGSLNTAVGQGSMQANTTGQTNTAIGTSSLLANTTGTGNTALGYFSLGNNTTAGQNTAVGNSALSLNTTGANNTAVGSGALTLNTTGLNNTAIGHSSLGANLTGSYNASLGISTLAANTTGSYNVAIGQATLLVNTTGQTNTGVGNSVLSANISGQANTAIGAGALQSNTTANSNTAIGVSALGSSTTGTLNTAIGYTAGGSITTGSNNTIIGNYGGTTTLANNIVLSDGLGNVRLFSDANGLIGINQAVGSTIGGQLDIHTSQTYALVLNGLTTSNAYTAFSNNSVGKWRIGNQYNAGANSFDIFNLTSSTNAISITSGNLVSIGGIAYGNSKLSLIPTTQPTTASSSNIQLSIGEATINTGYSFKIGYLNTAGGYVGSIQSIAASNAVPTLINPDGGAVLVGTYTDDTINKLQVTGSIKSTTQIISNQFNVQSGGVYFSYNDTNTNYWYTRVLVAASNNFRFNYNGTDKAEINNATGVYTSLSDINKKKDFELSTLGLNAILGLKPTLYRMKTENNTNKHLGFIAQEVKEFIPQAFVETNDFIGLNYQSITATLVKAIQELNEKLVRNNIN